MVLQKWTLKERRKKRLEFMEESLGFTRRQNTGAIDLFLVEADGEFYTEVGLPGCQRASIPYRSSSL